MNPSMVILELKDEVATLTLNDSKNMNALGEQMIRELRNLIREINEMDEVRVVILVGAGGNFSAGGNLKEILNFDSKTALNFHKILNEISYLMRHSSKIFLVGMEGYALGGGFEISLSADIRICSEDTILGQPEIGLGLNAGAGGNAILPRVVGRSNALYLALTGRKITSSEAKNLNIIQKVVPDGKLLEELHDLARDIILLPPETVSLTKLCINSATETPAGTSLDMEALAFSLLNTNKDVKQRIGKFFEEKNRK